MADYRFRPRPERERESYGDDRSPSVLVSRTLFNLPSLKGKSPLPSGNRRTDGQTDRQREEDNVIPSQHKKVVSGREGGSDSCGFLWPEERRLSVPLSLPDKMMDIAKTRGERERRATTTATRGPKDDFMEIRTKQRRMETERDE